MALSHISDLPDAPLPTDEASIFDSKAFPFVAAQQNFVDEMNANIDELNIRLYGYPIVVETTTTRALNINDAGKYIRLTNAGAKTITIGADEGGGPRIGKVWNFRNVGAGLASFDFDDGVITVVPNAGGSLDFASGANVSIICVDQDYYEVMGQTELA